MLFFHCKSSSWGLKGFCSLTIPPLWRIFPSIMLRKSAGRLPQLLIAQDKGAGWGKVGRELVVLLGTLAQPCSLEEDFRELQPTSPCHSQCERATVVAAGCWTATLSWSSLPSLDPSRALNPHSEQESPSSIFHPPGPPLPLFLPSASPGDLPYSHHHQEWEQGGGICSWERLELSYTVLFGFFGVFFCHWFL